jgi:hypothetical protein
MASNVSAIPVLEPDGVRLDIPSVLMVKETELSGEAILLYRWESVAEEWVKVGSAHTGPDRMATAPNIQLSRYGLAD